MDTSHRDSNRLPVLSRDEFYLLYEKPRVCRVREVRIKSGLTQFDFSLSLGLARTTIARIERGAMPAYYQILLLINYFYGISLSWLLHGTGVYYGERVTDLQSIIENIKSCKLRFMK